jgi:Fe2+ transport system protein FeoA
MTPGIAQTAVRSQEPSVTLSDLAVGVPATLDCALLPKNDVAFLAALGLYRECRLCVRQHGCACIVEVDSTRLAMAGTVARQILVKPDPAGGGGAG